MGIDPSAAMIEVARQTTEEVDWRVGDIESIEPLGVDLAIMTGHVAQFFISDDEWRSALAGLRRALRSGGWLAFESRDPRAREWERWTPDFTSVAVYPDLGSIEHWSEASRMKDGVVDYSNHYRFLDSREERMVSGQLRFRSEHDIRDSLEAAGFATSTVFGTWDRQPVGEGTLELIVVAQESSPR